MTTLKVSTSTGKIIEGEFLALDPVTRSLALKLSNGSVSIINSDQISQIAGSIQESIKLPEPIPTDISLDDIRQHEDAALKMAAKSLQAINLNVPGEIQTLFDRISLIFGNCRWKGNSIEVLDVYEINPPYVSVTLGPGKEGREGLDRISKFLEGERRKLNI